MLARDGAPSSRRHRLDDGRADRLEIFGRVNGKRPEGGPGIGVGGSRRAEQDDTPPGLIGKPGRDLGQPGAARLADPDPGAGSLAERMNLRALRGQRR